VLLHGFPDSTHLYDRLVPHLAGRRPVLRFDFLGWGRSDKPQGYLYTAANQAGDLAAVVAALGEHLDASQLVLVAYDASGHYVQVDQPERVAASSWAASGVTGDRRYGLSAQDAVSWPASWVPVVADWPSWPEPVTTRARRTPTGSAGRFRAGCTHFYDS
jgi:hypothetical protein